jgi:predicted Zn-dependent peptidase
VNFLAKDADRALQLFFDMLRKPRFQEDRFKLYKTQVLQNMERRNDSTDSIESREWSRLMRGADHFTTAASTKASIDGLTREDLIAFHQKWLHPGNMVLAISGDFKPADLQPKIEKAMAGWAAPAQAAAPPVPKPAHKPVPGVYMVNKADVNQGRVSLGHLGIMRGDPDEIVVEMMNDVLGGSGFTSRITNRVRSDEGLAYSAGSSFTPGDYYAGTFRGSFQSKSPTVAQATQIVLDEIRKMQKEKISEEELETVKNYAINVFPRVFASAAATASLYATDELIGRDTGYWKTYRSRVSAITTDAVQKAAVKYLQPDQAVILVVGNVEDILKGNPDKPQYSFDKIAGGKPVVRLPLPDPLTMKYPEKE